ncbi:MAG: peptidylprolyl isomerase [Opitutus sp.]|nr:peptidylprolyl isomerase [Opitutus sp.]
MTLRRSLPLLLLAATTGATVLAQTAAPSTDLNARFANGIVAVAEEKIITVADVNREVAPLLPQIQREARNEKEYNEKVEQLYDSVIQELIDRVLIIKEFRKKKDGDNQRHIPDSYIDSDIAQRQTDQFDNDRSKFLSYLRSRGTTIREFRKEVEEEIIYRYMQGQQRKSQSVVSPVRLENFYNENKDQFYEEDKAHLRMIQLTRTDDATDDQLKAQADAILTRFRNGEKFEDLAKEFSNGANRSKGGDWGWQKRSDLVKAYSDPLFALKKGEVTAPIVLPEGCFILFAEDRKFAGIQPIDEVRDQIERILVAQMTRSGQEHWLERLRRNGYVKHY